MGLQASLNYAQEVHVAKTRTDPAYYTTIQAAIDAITDNAAGKRYVVIVHPGEYDEQVTMEDYVDLIAAGGREETIITHTCAAHDEATLTGENAIIKGFTLVSDGAVGVFRARCVNAGVAAFEMEDCVLTPQNTAAAAIALNATASCDIRDCVVDNAGAAATGALFTTAAQTYNVARTSFNAATDAIQVTLAITALNLTDCTVSNNFNQDAGTVAIVRCQMEAVALGTAACTLTAELTRFTAAFATADAFAHTVTCHKCSFSGQNLNNAATGATTINLRGCDGIATLTNAGVGGTLNLYECGVETLTTTQGTVVAYGGRINACGGSSGTSFVWWRHGGELMVLPTMLIADALGAASSGDIVRLGQGTYAESNLTAVSGVNIIGEGYGVSLIETADAANPIVAVGDNVTCEIHMAKVSNTLAGGAITVSPVANNSALTLVECWVAGTGAGDAVTVSIGGAGNGTLNADRCDFTGNAATSIVVLAQTLGAGLLFFNSFDCNFDTSGGAANAAIEASAAVVADVNVARARFSGCTLAVYCTGANHTVDVDDSEFNVTGVAAAGVQLAANAPVVNLTKCNDVGTFTHSTASTVTMRECYVSGGYTTAAVAAIVNAHQCHLSAVTHGGSGAFTMENCIAGTVANNSTATMTIDSSNIGTLTQAAAAGTVNVFNTQMGDISTGAAGTVRLNGGCLFTDIAANAGVLTWRKDPNHIKVVAGTANMNIADALTLAAAGDEIEIGLGTFAESNLTAVNGVDIIGEGPDTSIIQATDNVNPIITVGSGVTCAFRGIRIENLGTGGVVAVTAGAAGAALTTRDCRIRSDGANPAFSLSTTGAGAPSLASSLDNIDNGSVGIAVTGAVVATVALRQGLFSSVTTAFTTTGANHTFTIDDTDFGTAGVTLTANTPVVTLTRCDDIGAFAHSTACTVTLRECYLSGTYTIGAVAGVVNADRVQFSTFTNGGSGAISFEQCTGTDINNNSTSTMTIEGGNWDTVLQGAAAGTINIHEAVIATELDCSAGGAINAYNCEVTTVDANGGTVTVYGGDLLDVADVTGNVLWWTQRNELTVFAGTVNMVVAQALAAASAGDYIRIRPGTYAESNLTLVASVNLVGTDPDQCLIVASSLANPILNAAVTCSLSNLTIGGTDAANPAIAVTANTLTVRNCYVYGTGAGDAITMVAGTLNAYDSTVGAGDINLSTAICTLSMYRCRITTDPIDTAGAFAHVLTFETCDFGAQNIASAATGGTTLSMTGCSNVGTITNAGTGAFTMYDSGISALNQTNGTGTMTVYGGYVGSVTRGLGAVVWWKHANELWVLPSGTTTDPMVASALAAASSGDTLRLTRGTFAESNLTMKAGVNLMGIGGGWQDSLIVLNTAANNIIVSAQSVVLSHLTIGNPNALAPAAIAISANTVTLNDCYVYTTTGQDSIALTGGGVTAFDCNIGVGSIDLSTGACTVFAMRCVIQIGGVDTAGAFAHTLTFRHCNFTAQNLASAATGATTLSMVGCTNVGTITNAGTGAFTIRESEVASVNQSNATGSISLFGGTLLACAGAVGSVTWKTAAQQYDVIAGMVVGRAITAAAADSPTPAATAPYTVLIHPGIYAEVVTCSSFVHLRGMAKDAVTIQQTNADVVTLASNLDIENLTVRITTPATTAKSLIKDNAAALTGVKLKDVVLAYTTPAAIANVGVLLTGGTTLTMERCSADWAVPGTGAEIVLSVTTAASTVMVDGCNFRNTNVTAGSLINVAFAGSVVTVVDSRLAGTVSHLVASAGIIRVSNSQYRSVARSGTGDIVDESPEAKSYAFHVVKTSFEVDVANATYATRTAVGGAVLEGGAGQARLRINDNALDAAGIENAADAAGALDSSFTAGQTIRYCRQISANAFRTTTDMFFGLRATLGAAVPGAAEDHFGFIWDGTNFKASSSDGAGVGQTTNLTTPSTGAQHQLEAIQLRTGVEFYVDGVLVATHTGVGIPTAGGNLDFQDYQISDGGGGATTSDVTLREGFIAECPA